MVDFVCDGVDARGVVPFLISELNLFWVVDQSFRELGAVDWEIAFTTNNCNGTLESLLSETLNGANCGGAAANYDDGLWRAWCALDVWFAAGTLDELWVLGLEVYAVGILAEGKGWEVVNGWGVLDVAGRGVEAGWLSYQ